MRYCEDRVYERFSILKVWVILEHKRKCENNSGNVGVEKICIVILPFQLMVCSSEWWLDFGCIESNEISSHCTITNKNLYMGVLCETIYAPF